MRIPFLDFLFGGTAARRPIAVPALFPRKPVSMGAGPTDFKFYLRPVGTIKAVMLFVDFSDVPGKEQTAAVADHLLGGGKAQQLFRDQSFGKLNLDVRVRSDLGWRRMPKPSTEYSFRPWDRHRDYVAAAAARFQSEVRFDEMQITMIVAPREARAFPDSPAFTVFPGDEAVTSSGKVRHAVTFGQDSYKNRFINLVHETGHLFGLPDLYPGGGGADDSAVGCWSIMSDIFRSVSFLGWDRHKNGWLDPSREVFVASPGRQTFHLAPFTASQGVSMVVLPADDAKKPSQVVVLEMAQPVLGTNGQQAGEGVLMYSVDASVPTLESPVRVLANHEGRDPSFGNLFRAPFGVGEATTQRVGNATVTLRVVGRNGSGFDVEVDYAR